MRVPNTGLSRDERHIVAEGYRLAEHLLRNYRDKPSPFTRVGQAFAQLRMVVLARR